MVKNGTIQNVAVTYGIPVEVLEGMILPDSIKRVSNWTPIRHGVLLNEYMKWCKEGCGSKQKFASYMAIAISQGLFPLFERTALDGTDTPITAYSIMSQLDWWTQKENQVITYSEENPAIKEFHPNNLMILTTKQKTAEATKSRSKQLKTDDAASNLADKILSLDPDTRAKLTELLMKA